MNGLARPGRAGDPVQAQGLAAERGQVAGLLPVAASPVPTNSEPSLAISSRQPPCRPVVAGKPGEEGRVEGRRVAACCRRQATTLTSCPPPVVGAAVTGVEATVRAEPGVDRQRHQAGLAAGPHAPRTGTSPRAASPAPREQALRRALGDQQPPPRVYLTSQGRSRPRDHPGHVEGGDHSRAGAWGGAALRGPSPVSGAARTVAGQGRQGTGERRRTQTTPVSARTIRRMRQTSPAALPAGGRHGVRP